MKVTLDLTELVARGELSREEADRLAKLGAAGTGSLGSNILLSFGMVAVALGGGFLFPSAQAVILIGVILFVPGLALILNRATKWELFAQSCVTLGALGIAGGAIVLSDNSPLVGVGLTLGLGAAAFLARSGLLAALAILQLSYVLGTGTAYWHASYFFGVDRPAFTISMLIVVAVALFLVSRQLASAYERVAIIAARTAILMLNGAFLVGSLFGDTTLGWPASWFSVAWAVLLVVAAVWGIYENRRWVVNAAAVFGAIHFYTQWFEYLGANPLSVLGGGILLVLFGLALRWLNGRLHRAPALA
ncbi:MAG: hypothetical protein BGO82_19310 [Devosia sp. 67-54]|uniref:hypothetical protein n=1 Tax=unclassified Devosia TaxID=196773 RepID=UPI00095A82F9|nr:MULTISPECIES: hypothetical protein [unclassified Devosia]MBN9306244.1 hypothetical protein [Devosia sp.]OJX18319.1 MAG: hypothetical protein BGO82_19310 [Devosia sp. 67-54]